MGSKNKPATFNNSDLKSSLSSIARRQNVLAAVPPAVRALPLLAFAAGDFYQRRYGEKQQAEWLFGPADGGGTGEVGMGSLGDGIEIGIGVGALGSGSTAVWLASGESTMVEWSLWRALPWAEEAWGVKDVDGRDPSPALVRVAWTEGDDDVAGLAS